MPVNPHFNFTTFRSEQGLVEDLIVEAIQIYGHSAYYIPREEADLDRLFGEDPLPLYEAAHEIEVYLKSNMQFQGASETLSKFGMIIEDDAVFLVAVRRFNEELGKTLIRPRENDILFIEMSPDNRYIFEIKFVENKEQLFQLGKLYTYELQCELMNYSHERVQTGIPEIDAVAEQKAYTLDLVFASGTGTFANGEQVYQGTSFLTAVSTGTVVNWSANTKTLSVQSVIGAFVANVPVVGVTSNASYMLVDLPDTSPHTRDAISDNDVLTADAPTILVPQTNPRYQ